MSTPTSGRTPTGRSISGDILTFQATDVYASADRDTVIFSGAKKGYLYRIDPVCPSGECWRSSPSEPFTGPQGGTITITSGELKGYSINSFLVKMPGNTSWYKVGSDIQHFLSPSDGDILGTHADLDSLYGDNEGYLPVTVRELDQDGGTEGDLNELACETFWELGGYIPTSGTQGPASFEISIEKDGVISLVDNVVLGGLAHDRANDLVMTLVSPQGTRVRLADRFDSDSIYSGDYSFLESSGNELELFAGTVVPQDARPFESFSAFIGERIAGTWRLEIRDYKEGDAGSLTWWGLDICYSTKVQDIYVAPPPLVGDRDVVATACDFGIYTTYRQFDPTGEWPTVFPDDPAVIDLVIPYAGIVINVESVVVRINHDRAGDLHCVLESPSGTRITVFHRPGYPAGGTGNEDSFLDDNILMFLETYRGYPLLPDTGDIGGPDAQYYSRDPGNWPGTTNDKGVTIGDYSSFAGEPAAGIWRVYLYDWNYPGGDGTVSEVHLSVRINDYD
jgi:subtilisin-like proprotein convertase family protein